MKKFKIEFGTEALDADFDGIYVMSEFFKFPTNSNNLKTEMKISVEDDNYDEYTIIAHLSFRCEQYQEIIDSWNNWIFSKEGEKWMKENTPIEKLSDSYSWVASSKAIEID